MIFGLLAILAGILLSTVAGAIDSGDFQFEELVGYTIVAVKTVEGYQDEDGNSKEEFDGCNYGWRIIFSDHRVLTCAGYHYHYAYRPKAVLFSNGSAWKMLVGDDVYDMRR